MQRLTASEAADQTPDWSPEGTEIAFDSTRDGNFEIYLMKSDGSDPRRCTQLHLGGSYPGRMGFRRSPQSRQLMGLGRGGLCLTAAVMGGSLLAGPVVALALSNGLPNTQVAFAIGLAIVWVGQLLGWLGLRRDESRILTRSRAVAGTLLILLPLLILALLVDGTVLADR